MTTSPSEDVRAYLSQHITNKMGANLPTTKVYFQGQKYTQPVGVPWVFVTIADNDTCKAALGDNGKYKTLGAVQVQCMAPEDSGTKALRSIVDVMTRILADQHVSVPGSGSITLYGVRKINRGTINGWMTINVVCEFRYWHTLTAL